MGLNAIKGGYDLPPADLAACNLHKAITAKVNSQFVQVGACWLRPAGKDPLSADWFKGQRGDVDLQGWIDDPNFNRLNVGFNLQMGWLDVDIDSSDTDYVRSIQQGLQACSVDTRFAYGRRSRGVPSHFLVQLPEDEAPNFEYLRCFEPRPVGFRGERYHTQLRSFATNQPGEAGRTAKQSVVPGSVYSRKYGDGPEYDISVWFGREGEARSVQDVAVTTARRTQFRDIVRGVAFGTVLYVVAPHWIEGSRQEVATKLTGWLARVVAASAAMNEQEAIAADVFCPVSTDSEAEALISLICAATNDEEAPMRIRVYRDARDKLARNPDAKIPGWHSVTELLGAEGVAALRTVLTPGSDVTRLSMLAERYVYDETDDVYIDRERHGRYAKFTHMASELERRHKSDTMFVGGKPREAFRIFESSNLRSRVGTRDLYPELSPGGIFRLDSYGNAVPDEYDGRASVVYNTWTGWPIQPADRVDPVIQAKCVAHLDRLFGYITRDNRAHAEWLQKWIAWTLQHPGIKQQVAPVIVGAQGVGKSFFGNTFLPALFTEQLWGTASANIVDQKFNVGPFINKMVVFIDEARFKTDSVVDEIKKLIRNVSNAGMEKFEDARTYRIFSRIVFASNGFNINVAEKDGRDRALFYIRTVDHESMAMSRIHFEEWARGLKPWFDEFASFLHDPNNVRQYLRYFMDLPVTKKELEDVSISASSEPAILESNVSWYRRIIRGILESGWIHDSGSDWGTPFDRVSFASRVQYEAKILGMREANVGVVLREFKLLVDVDNITENYRGAGVVRIRTKSKWGTCIDRFRSETNLELHPYRELGEEDYGSNDDGKSTPPKARIGAAPDLQAKF